MNKINITLEGKEYQIDIQKAKELGLLKEKDQRCKSWEDFHNKYQSKKGFFYDADSMRIDIINNPVMTAEQLTENESVAIKVFSRLLKLRRDWIGDWKPDWTNVKYCIEVYSNEINVSSFSKYSRTFSFPTKEMAIEFLNCFKDLFEQCKYLI